MLQGLVCVLAMQLIKLRNKALVGAQGLLLLLGTCLMEVGGVITRPLTGDQLPVFLDQAGGFLGQGGFGAVSRGLLMGTGLAGKVCVTGILNALDTTCSTVVQPQAGLLSALLSASNLLKTIKFSCCS